MLTPNQLARIKRIAISWKATLPPCGISTIDVYNPCLPEDFEGKLVCVTCGLPQRLEITTKGTQ